MDGRADQKSYRRATRGDNNDDAVIMSEARYSVFVCTRSPFKIVMPWWLSIDSGGLSKILLLR